MHNLEVAGSNPAPATNEKKPRVVRGFLRDGIGSVTTSTVPRYLPVCLRISFVSIIFSLSITSQTASATTGTFTGRAVVMLFAVPPSA
ncbi:MAG: hypothetical protein HYU35_01160 [Parcubacteria group bacterium]|nr:hypothetical protein [Parcubacteria group bacterium]